MSSASNKLFIALIACLFIISIASARPVQTEIGLNEHGLSLSRADGNISPNLGMKIANSKPEDQIPVIVFMKKPDKIKTSKTALRSLLSSAVESSGGKVGHKYNVIDAFSAKIPASKISELSRMPEVKRIYYDQIVSLPPQPLPETGILMTRSTQTIGANYVWNTSGYTGTGIKVSIIDTGINYTHPDLGGGFGSGKKVADGYDFVNNDADPMDDNGHGTHVAGTVAANGAIKGVAPGATLFAVKVLNSAGSGSTSDIIAAIDWSIAHGANIISMSLGGSVQPNDEFADVMNVISDAAVDKGVVMVIAAGNEGSGTGTTGIPASSKKVITVGASSSAGTITILDDTIASFSNRGPSAFGRLDPEVVAPGVSINSTYYTGGYAVLSGTSMAAPHVSGAVALLLQKNPALTPAQVRAILMHTASNLTTSNIHVFEKGAGIINLTNAFTYNISASINGDDRWEESALAGFSTIGRLVLNNNNAQSVNFTFSLEAMTDLERDNNIPASSFYLPGYEIVNAGSSKTINITFTPPSGVKPAIYGTTLIASNPTYGTLRIPVVITIPLMSSGSIQGTVNDADADSGDWIYYKLKSYNGTTLKAYLNWTDSSDDLDFYLFAPNGELLSYSAIGYSVSEVVTLSNMVYDEYWVAVHAYYLNSSGSYFLNVSYPAGTKGNLEVNPSSLQIAVASNELKNITFSITNDATAKSDLSLNVKKLIAGGNDFSSGTIANIGLFYSRIWDVSSSGMNLNNTRYMNVTLQWVDPANNLDLLLAYYNGTQWVATPFGSAHNNSQLNEAWEKLENIDIQHYLKSYPNFGIYIQNTGSSETYDLTINFTDIAPWSGASVSETSISLSSGQTRQVNITIDGSQLTQNVTDLVFTIQDSTEDYAAVPVRINLDISSPATAPALVSAITPNSRNAQIGTPVTLFLSVINYGTATANDVSITQASSLPATVSYQQWDGTAFTGSANTSVDMPAGSTANFVITLDATSAFDSSSLTFNASGTNVEAAPVSAVNTLTISGSATPSADVIMMSTSLDVSTAVNTPTVFAVATSNVGEASATGASFVLDIPSTITGLVYQLNETYHANGTIKGPATGLTIGVGAQPTFAVFLTPTQPIAYDPANNRITLQLVDGSGKVIGAQSVAVSTT